MLTGISVCGRNIYTICLVKATRPVGWNQYVVSVLAFTCYEGCLIPWISTLRRNLLYYIKESGLLVIDISVTMADMYVYGYSILNRSPSFIPIDLRTVHNAAIILDYELQRLLHLRCKVLVYFFRFLLCLLYSLPK